MPARCCPAATARPAGALVVLSEPVEPWDVAAAHGRLPEGDWRLGTVRGATSTRARRRSAGRSPATASIATASATPGRAASRSPRTPPAGAAIVAEAICLARDLINTPAADLGPAELAEAVAARRGAVRRDLPDHGRRRSARRELSGDPRGRPGEPARAAAGRPHLGRGERAARDPGRQGRVLRYRRARPQDLVRHAADEEGHGRRRGDARPRPGDHGDEAAGPPAAADRRGREQRRRQRVPPGRRARARARA